MEALVLCFFDNLKGPTISNVLDLEGRSAPAKLPLDVREEIAKFIDMQTGQKFFTYGFTNYASANLYFDIPSNLARGNREILCLSALIHSGKPKLLKETLLVGSKRLKAIPNLYLAFHVNLKVPDPEVTQKQRELEESLSNLCKEILHARDKATTQEHERESKRNRIRDQERDRDRDDARDLKRDGARDLKRDEPRDLKRDDTRDPKRDKARDRRRDATQC